MDDTDILENANDDDPSEGPGAEQAAADDAGEESLDQLIDKKAREDEGPDEDEEESVLREQGEDRVTGTLPSNVKPKQSSEFTCRKCFLVKHHSQLANKKRMLCRDCA